MNTPHSKVSLEGDDSSHNMNPCLCVEPLTPENKQRCPDCKHCVSIKDTMHKKDYFSPTQPYLSHTRALSRGYTIIRSLGTYFIFLFNRSSMALITSNNPKASRIPMSTLYRVPEAFLESFQKLHVSTTTATNRCKKLCTQSSPLSESSDLRSDQTPTFRTTPTFLEILEAATKGISSTVTSSTTSATAHKRPRGRPESVPGAMSRSTVLNMNEHEYNRMSTSNPTVVRYLGDIYDDRKIMSSSFFEDSDRFPDLETASSEDGIKKSRGRPRKYTVTSLDDSSAVRRIMGNGGIAESVYTTNLSRSPPLLPPSFKRPKATKSFTSNTIGGSYESTYGEVEETKMRKRVVKTLPKAKPRRKNDEMDANTNESDASSASSTNENVKVIAGSDEFEPPNLQKYYRTELLSSEEEYSLGMKVQFVMRCEQVHEGLFLHSDRTPTVVEWANACGFKEHDPVMCAPDYVESDIDLMIRPSKSDLFDDDMDPSMFVGNGLVNASGVGRGKGRVKKPPPVELKDYFDDTPIRFCKYTDELNQEEDEDEDEVMRNEIQKTNLKMRPINRGSPRDFVNMMMIGREAKQRMVQCNMRLVVSIAKRYRHVGVNIADLVQEGSIGLSRAAEKFDPRKGFKFSTYASWWIQQAVFRSIAYHSRTIRLPVHVHNLLNRVRRVRLQLQQILGRTPTNEEMAAELNMTLPKYNKMLRLTRRAISLEMPKYQNNPKDIGQESEMLVGDTIDATEVIKDENSPEQSVDQVLFHDDLQAMLQILSEDERRVVRARYGLDDGLTRTVSSVAAQMGQSKSWVRSMECRALRKLRRPWYEKRLWEHQNSLRR